MNFPNPDSVVSIPTFIEFMKDLILAMWGSIKFVFNFFIHIFDPTYYMYIFSFLPSPFNVVLVSLVSLVLTIIFIKLISMLWSVIKVW